MATFLLVENMNEGPTAGHPARILVVDDDRDNREVLGVVLRCEGFVVLSAASGEEALAIVAQQSPDLILLDVMMPGMNGYNVAARIKGTHATKSIPIMMVTALDDSVSRARALDVGADDFLVKPFDRAELCLRVKNLLRRRTRGSGVRLIEGASADCECGAARASSCSCS
jgi:diguanylate cyclase